MQPKEVAALYDHSFKPSPMNAAVLFGGEKGGELFVERDRP